jgi:gluconokinase
MSILSLEASTSSAKAMLYDTEQGLIGVESIPYSAEVSDVVTFSAEGVADTVLQCGAALLARFPDIKVEGIGLSSIWHSLILLDGDKAPLGRGYTWADTSPAPTVAHFKQDAALASRVYHATGCPIHSIYNGWKWMHLKRTGDVSQAKYISCLPEYLFFAMTGELAITQSAATGSALLSTDTLDWDAGMLELMGVRREMLGHLVEPQYSQPLSAAAASRLGLPQGIPVAAAGPDGALNHIAAGGLGSGAMTLSVGTSGALRLAHAGPVIPMQQSTWCYYGAEGLHLIGAATSGAGNCVNWFTKDLLGGAFKYSQLEAAAVAADPNSAPYFLPFNFGERCPGWQDSRQGGFCGIGSEAGIGPMYRAVLEGILFNLYQNYLILVENIGFSPSMISISGGITQSPFWMALAADTFGAVLEENTGEHASLLGAAYMAQRAIGQIASLRDITVEAGKTHSPDMVRHEQIMKRFEKWMEYYAQA